MEFKKVGIVITSRTPKVIEGYLLRVRPNVTIKDDGRIMVNLEETKTSFILCNGRRLTAGPWVRLSSMTEVAKELEKIGYKNINLYFNDQNIKF